MEGTSAKIIAWVLFCLIDGVTDAVVYYNHPVRSHSKPNEHTWYFWRRIVVSLALFFPYWPLMLFSGLVFPLLHDGSQYFTSNRLTKGAVYRNGFFSEPSEMSTARRDLSLVERCFTMVIGLIVLYLWIRGDFRV